MYLCETIHDFEGSVYETVGIVPANRIMQQKPQKVGYVTATAKKRYVTRGRKYIPSWA